ncbi:unnamed protein product [Ceratitis capitata]|uniref:(Mediterranean fruit fly) hypothetical protein n=1 Tax=Ceratitis capitata TaxID=7213 RepID=A0A811VIN0_CERCA|nr:unnamed protein product [Ceratitis capitata]
MHWHIVESGHIVSVKKITTKGSSLYSPTSDAININTNNDIDWNMHSQQQQWVLKILPIIIALIGGKADNISNAISSNIGEKETNLRGQQTVRWIVSVWRL